MGEPVPRAAQRHHAPRRAGGGQPGASARGLGAGGERRAVLRPRSARGAGHGGAGRNGDRAEL